MSPDKLISSNSVMAHSPRLALAKSKSPTLQKVLGSPQPFGRLDAATMQNPLVKQQGRPTNPQATVKKTMTKSSSSTQVTNRLTQSAQLSTVHNSSLAAVKSPPKLKTKPKKKIICEQAQDRRPRTYGKYSNTETVNDTSKLSSRPSISALPLSIQQVEGEDGSQTYRIQADLEEIKQEESVIEKAYDESAVSSPVRKQMKFAKTISLLVGEFDNKEVEKEGKGESNPERRDELLKNDPEQQEKPLVQRPINFKKVILGERLALRSVVEPPEVQYLVVSEVPKEEPVALEVERQQEETPAQNVSVENEHIEVENIAQQDTDEHINELKNMIKQHLTLNMEEELKHIAQSDLAEYADMFEQSEEQPDNVVVPTPNEQPHKEAAEQHDKETNEGEKTVEEPVEDATVKLEGGSVEQPIEQKETVELEHSQPVEEPVEEAMKEALQSSIQIEVQQPPKLAVQQTDILPPFIEKVRKECEQQEAQADTIVDEKVETVVEKTPMPALSSTLADSRLKQIEYLQNAGIMDGISSIPYNPSMDNSVVSNALIEQAAELKPSIPHPTEVVIPPRDRYRHTQRQPQNKIIEKKQTKLAEDKEEKNEKARNRFIGGSLLRKLQHAPIKQDISSPKQVPLVNSAEGSPSDVRLLALSRSQEILGFGDIRQRVQQSVQLIRSRSQERSRYRSILLRTTSKPEDSYISRGHPLEEIDHYIGSMLGQRTILLTEKSSVDPMVKIAAEKVRDHTKQVSDNFLTAKLSAVLKVNKRTWRQCTLEQIYGEEQLLITRLPKHSALMRLSKLRERLRNISRQELGQSSSNTAFEEGQQLDRKLSGFRSLLERVEQVQSKITAKLATTYMSDSGMLGTLFAAVGVNSHLFELSPGTSADPHQQTQFNKILISGLVSRLAKNLHLQS